MKENIEELRHGFSLKGDRNEAVLLIHGFGGSPLDNIYLAKALNEEGYSVSCICLPGHCEKIEDFDHSSYKEWMSASEDEFIMLRKIYRRVYLLGFSMGGLLALNIAEKYKDIPALALISPALSYRHFMTRFAPLIAPFKKHFAYSPANLPDDNDRYLNAGYNEGSFMAVRQLTRLQKKVRVSLRSISMPFIAFFAKDDELIDPDRSARILSKRTLSPLTSYKVYDRGGHLIPLNENRNDSASRIIDFFSSHI